MKIALVTYKDNGKYHLINVANEDDTLLDFLKAKEYHITKEIWNDAEVKWENYDLVILKSPWDYFDLIEDFYTWLTKLEHQKIRLLNPIDIVKWNADKHYLQEIEKAGLKVTPSTFLSKGERINLITYFELFNTDQLIVKPCVSGGSKNTFKVTATNVEEITATLTQLILNEDFIIQPFLKEIEEHGEWSFLFFNGKFSHAILKKAKEGDFRVQASFGGTVNAKNAPVDYLHSAQLYVNQFAKGCLYARVDGTIIDGEFYLMELELIEPFLFLAEHQDSLANYHQALQQLT